MGFGFDLVAGEPGGPETAADAGFAGKAAGRDFPDHAEGLAGRPVVIDIYGAEGGTAGDQSGVNVCGGFGQPIVCGTFRDCFHF